MCQPSLANVSCFWFLDELTAGCHARGPLLADVWLPPCTVIASSLPPCTVIASPLSLRAGSVAPSSARVTGLNCRRQWPLPFNFFFCYGRCKLLLQTLRTIAANECFLRFLSRHCLPLSFPNRYRTCNKKRKIALFSSYPALFASLLLLNVRVVFFLEGPYFYTKLEKKQVYVLFLIRTFCIYYLEMI